MDCGRQLLDAEAMSATLTVLTILLFFAALAVAGPRWGADTRSAGGWRVCRDPQPLWPVDLAVASPVADPPDDRR